MGQLFESFVSLAAGMDSYRSPILLGDASVAKAVNVSFRGSLPSTRPAFVEDRLLPSGFFQGAGTWSTSGGDLLVYVATGEVFVLLLDPDELVTLGDCLSHTRQCFMVQAGRFLIVQDGMSPPVVLDMVDGAPARIEPDTRHSIPPGTISTYAHGRIHMVPRYVPGYDTPGEAFLVSGDVLEPWDPKTVLRFTETSYLNEGGAHGLPNEMGPIGGLGSLRNSATGTGVGQTIVFARNGVCAFDFSLSRDTEWKSRALSQVLFFSAGSESPWSVLNVNNDLIYRSVDGIRTLKYSASTQAGSSGGLSNLPISYEVDSWLRLDGERLAWVSAADKANRILTTSVPDTSTDWFRGLVSWDVAAGFFATGQTGAAYDGLWTGDRFCKVCKAIRNGSPELFVFSEGPRLLRMSDDTRDDELLTDRLPAEDSVSVSGGVVSVSNANDTPVAHRIESRLDTKTYVFDSINMYKRFDYVDLWFSDVLGLVEVSLYMRPHQYPKWIPVSERAITVSADSMPQGTHRFRLSAPEIAEYCDPGSGTTPDGGYALQFSIHWKGRATLERAVFSADPVSEEPPGTCDITADAIAETDDLAGVSLDDVGYLPARSIYSPTTYPVTYDANSADATGGVGDQLKLNGTSLVLRDGSGFSLPGNVLDSWNTQADGFGDTFALGVSYTADAPLTLYAVWTPVSEYVVTYDANEATSGTVPSQYKTHDEDLHLRYRGSLVKAGHYFAGWNTLPDGYGDDYYEGELYEGNADLVLYAKWVADPWYITPDDYSIVFADESWPNYVRYSSYPSYSGQIKAGPGWAVDTSHWYSHMEDYDPERFVVFDLGTGNELWPAEALSTATPSSRRNPLDESHMPLLDRHQEPPDMWAAVEAKIEELFGEGVWTTANKVHIHVDVSGSMTRSLVSHVLDELSAKLTAGGVTYRVTPHTDERWLRWLVPPIAPDPSLFTVQYDGNGNDADQPNPADQVALVGETVVVRGQESLTRVGYAFDGWNTSSDGTGDSYNAAGLYTAGADVTLYAQWEVQAFTLSFNSNGGSEVLPITQYYGTDVTAPDDPTRADYDFMGWTPAVPTTMPGYDMELVAEWLLAYTTITFDVDGGTPAIDPITQLRGTSYTAPADPTKAGYGFAHWSPALPSVMPDDDLTVAAQWVELVTISFEPDGGDPISDVTGMKGYGFTEPTPTRTGYTHVGWSPELPAVLPDDPTTYTALWEVNQYTLTVDDGDGVTREFVYDYGGAVSVAEPTRQYFTFWKWSPAMPSTMPAADTTIYSVWEWDEANQWSPSRYAHLLELWLDAGDSSTKSLDEYGGVAVWYDKSPNAHNLSQTEPAERPITVVRNNVERVKFRYRYHVVDDISGFSSLGNATADFPLDERTVVALFKGLDGQGEARYMKFGDSSFYTSLWISTGYYDDLSYRVHSEDYRLLSGLSNNWGQYDKPYEFMAIVAGSNAAGDEFWLNGALADSNPAPLGLPALTGAGVTLGRVGSETPQIVEHYEILYLNSNISTSLREKIEGYFGWKYGAALLSEHPYKSAPPPMEYIMSFDTDGGSSIDPLVQQPGTAVSAPADPTRTGYTFDGWSPSIPTTTPSADTAYTALWVADTYVVSYDGNSADSGTAPSSQDKTHDVDLTLAGNTGTLVKSGFTLTGWNTQSDGAGTHYDLSGTYSANAAVLLYAEWTA